MSCYLKKFFGEVTNILAQTTFCANWVYLSASMQTHKVFLVKKAKSTGRIPTHKIPAYYEIHPLSKTKFLATKFGAELLKTFFLKDINLYRV